MKKDHSYDLLNFRKNENDSPYVKDEKELEISCSIPLSLEIPEPLQVKESDSVKVNINQTNNLLPNESSLNVASPFINSNVHNMNFYNIANFPKKNLFSNNK